jgi:dUTP pyrophosphatase
MLLKIKPTSDMTKVFYANHETFHEGDSGLDLFFPNDIVIPGNMPTAVLVDLEIQCEALSEGRRPVSFYLYPRSSISKTPLRMANSVGIIDAGYRGNLMAAIDNIGENPYTISAGQRLFQICSPDLSPITMEIANHLSDTERGSGGFGSTG